MTKLDTSDEVERYVEFCAERYQQYKQAQEKLVYFVASIFTLILGATGVLGAVEGKKVDFSLLHVLFFDLLLLTCWLLYLHKKSSAALYGTSLHFAGKYLSEIRNIPSGAPTYTRLWDTIHGQRGPTIWYARVGGVLLIAMYAVGSCALLAPSSPDWMALLKSPAILLKCLWFLVIALIHRKYRSNTKELQSEIASRWHRFRGAA